MLCKTRFDKVVILMRVALELGIFPDIDKKITGKTVLCKLFDNLMDKSEKQSVLFDYIYVTVKEHIYSKVPIQEQKKEFIRLVNLNNIEQEFQTNLEQWIKEEFQ